MLGFTITDKEGNHNAQLEKRVKQAINTFDLYSPQYLDGEDLYKLVGVPEKVDNMYYFSNIKKETSMNRRTVDDETVDITNSRVNTDDLAKFAINFRFNLIVFDLKGHFGTAQFKKVLLYVINEALKGKDLDEYILNLNDLNFEKKDWTLENIEEQLSKLKFLESFHLCIDFPKYTVALPQLKGYFGISEHHSISKPEGIDFNNLRLQTILKILKENYELLKEVEMDECITIECTDSKGHLFTVNKEKKKFAPGFRKEVNSMEEFIDKTKDIIEDYMATYAVSEE